jgi:hypothetical protein
LNLPGKHPSTVGKFQPSAVSAPLTGQLESFTFLGAPDLFSRTGRSLAEPQTSFRLINALHGCEVLAALIGSTLISVS